MLPLIALTIVCIVTYTLEITFGLAGTILMLPLMSFFYDTRTLVIYSLLPQILVAAIGLWRSPRTVDLRVLSRMLLFAGIGGVVGLALFYYFSASMFQMLLASVITLFGVYLVLAPGRIRIAPRLTPVFDTVAGASAALFGISGPITLTRLLGTFDNKTTVRNYALAFFLATNLFRAGGYVINGTVTPDIAEMMIFTGPFLALTLWFSNHLHFRINETHFRRGVAWLVLLGGLTLFYR
jgi:uncharacterized membrane protein YfcA